ncbi:hypothetical protein RU07_09990 [Agrobacterium tumefaciens]|uniref:Uncharacterized protein n=1 Tax=Agrobacterium tumefaciens TaxID=358 RepID=A0A0D0KWW0_AGRTU|nr:hypothetical protein RU07_09990 [Agrobacterium tumefaciens]
MRGADFFWKHRLAESNFPLLAMSDLDLAQNQTSVTVRRSDGKSLWLCKPSYRMIGISATSAGSASRKFTATLTRPSSSAFVLRHETRLPHVVQNLNDRTFDSR